MKNSTLEELASKWESYAQRDQNEYAEDSESGRLATVREVTTQEVFRKCADDLRSLIAILPE